MPGYMDGCVKYKLPAACIVQRGMVTMIPGESARTFSGLFLIRTTVSVSSPIHVFLGIKAYGYLVVWPRRRPPALTCSGMRKGFWLHCDSRLAAIPARGSFCNALSMVSETMICGCGLPGVHQVTAGLHQFNHIIFHSERLYYFPEGAGTQWVYFQQYRAGWHDRYGCHPLPVTAMPP